MPKYPHIQCAAHSLSLLIEDITVLTWVTEILTKTKYQQILIFYRFGINAKANSNIPPWMVFVGYSFGVHKPYAQIVLISSSNYQKDPTNTKVPDAYKDNQRCKLP